MSAAAAVTHAPAGERVLSAGAYLVGAIEIGVVLAALAFGARRVRVLLLPGWSGAPALLAEVVMGVSGLGSSAARWWPGPSSPASRLA